MPTITAGNIISRAKTLLQDTAGVRWTEQELLDWLNDGQRQVVFLKPEAKVTTSSISLAAGTKQSLPATALVLIDIVRNAPGGVPGAAVRRHDRKVLDDMLPAWHSSPSSATVSYFTYDPRTPKIFYVYPPAAAGAVVEASYSAPPTDCATTASVIDLDDVFMGALVDYILYRAHSKDSDYAANGGPATTAYEQFINALGLREQVETAAQP
jgi:hypothetical protein